MKRTPVHQIITKHLESHRSEWVKKTELYSICGEHGHSPESVGRASRLLEQEGKIKVGYYDSVYAKNLAQYCIGEPKKPFTQWEEIIKDDGTRVMIPVQTII